MLPQEVRNIFRREYRVGRYAADFFTVIHSQSEQCFVREYHPELIVNDDHSLVEFFKDVLRMAKPIRSLDIDVRHGFVQSGELQSLPEIVSFPSE